MKKLTINLNQNNMNTQTNCNPKDIQIYPGSRSNQISEGYYNHLVGEINRGTVKAAVLKTEDKRFFNRDVKYFLISKK